MVLYIMRPLKQSLPEGSSSGYFCHHLYKLFKTSACGKFKGYGYITSMTPGEVAERRLKQKLKRGKVTKKKNGGRKHEIDSSSF